GVEPAGMQPHVNTSVSSTNTVEHTSPAGHAPPHWGPSPSDPPVAAHGVVVSGRQVHDVVGPAATVAQQLCPAGQAPPQPGKVPQAAPPCTVVDVVDEVAVVVVVGGDASSASMAATSLRTWLAIAAASPLVGQAPAARDLARAHFAANFASQC